MGDMRELLEVTNQFMVVLSPIIAIGIGISAALTILNLIGRLLIEMSKWDGHKSHDEPEKEKGLPSEWEMRINRLLDVVLGEPLDEKRKNDELVDDEIVLVDFADEERLK